MSPSTSTFSTKTLSRCLRSSRPNFFPPLRHCGSHAVADRKCVRARGVASSRAVMSPQLRKQHVTTDSSSFSLHLFKKNCILPLCYYCPMKSLEPMCCVFCFFWTEGVFAANVSLVVWTRGGNSLPLTATVAQNR